MIGFQPCLHPTDAGGTRFSRVTGQLLRDGNVMARVAGILSAQAGLLAKMLLLDQQQPRALGKQGNTLYIVWYVPSCSAGRLEPSPAVQHKNVLCAALFSIKLNKDGLSPPQSRHGE